MAEEALPARPELRVSHEDRDRTAELLRVAAGDGRLTLEELDERLERALTARTGSELAVLVEDLPVEAAAVRDEVRIVADASAARRDGRWAVPRAMVVQVVSGSVVLDFTEAVITEPTLRISVDVTTGSLVLVTAPGIEVDTEDVTLSASHVAVKPSNPDGADVPTRLRIIVTGSVRSGVVAARPPRVRRRGFFARLRGLFSRREIGRSRG